jgi:hypothetical protein
VTDGSGRTTAPRRSRGRSRRPSIRQQWKEQRRGKARLRDTLAALLFLAAGVYIALLGALGLAGHPRDPLADVAEGSRFFWFAVFVGGCALLAGGILVLRRARATRLAWWLTLIAAVPAFLLMVWTAIAQIVAAVRPTSSDMAVWAVIASFVLLGLVGRLRTAKPAEQPPTANPAE